MRVGPSRAILFLIRSRKSRNDPRSYLGEVMALITRLLACLAWFGFLGAFAVVHAQDRRQNEPGKFDFYVLSLSWSPSFCAANVERGFQRSDPQCGPRPFSFVVHGMWPQYEKGFPEFCQVPS